MFRGRGGTVKVAIYTRVSTSNKTCVSGRWAYDQNPEVQESPLKKKIEQNGWQLYSTYSDRASGIKQSRPGLDKLIQDAKMCSFDAVLVFRFDRISRSAKQLICILDELNSFGVRLISYM